MVEIEEVPGYFVTEDGRLFSSKRSGRYLTGGVDRDGYRMFSLWHTQEKRRYTVKLHRLVAKYFVQRPEGFDIVNHLDGDISNNHKDNLEWTTISGNTRHAYKLGAISQKGENNNSCKYTDEVVHKVRSEYAGGSIASYAREVNLPYSVVYSYIKGLRR